MSPFSRYFHQLRMVHGIRQVELAELMGYEQSYISALEIGTKGPPTQEFVERLIMALSLPQDQQDELREVVAASQRKFVIHSDVSEDVYWLLLDLRRHLDSLHPAEVKLLRDIIRLKDMTIQHVPSPAHRLRRRQKEASKM